MAGSVLLLAAKRKDMKKFVPAGLFAFYWIVLWVEFAEHFNWWWFPFKAFPYSDASASAMFIVYPVIGMFWIRYAPSDFRGLLAWGLLFASILTGIEYLAETYTTLIKYGSGYDWYYSFILYFLSLFAWRAFHVWFYKKIREATRR